MARTWWGTFDFELDEVRRWQIGPLGLWLTRRAEEWRLSTVSSGEGTAEDLAIAEPASEDEIPESEVKTARFGFRSPPDSIRLLPATADRDVVVKGASPFFVPSGEEIRVFVSTSLWLRIEAAGAREPLHDIPIHRPTDTWFGPSPMVGELGYAAKISVRFRLDNVPQRPHRAITVVRIRNRAEEQLGLNRLKLPLPYLSLYGNEAGQLWTEEVTLERESSDGQATVRLSRGAPKVAGKANRIVGPRREAERGLLTRTFGTLFGLKGTEAHGPVVE